MQRIFTDLWHYNKHSMQGIKVFIDCQEKQNRESSANVLRIHANASIQDCHE